MHIQQSPIRLQGAPSLLIFRQYFAIVWPAVNTAVTVTVPVLVGVPELSNLFFVKCPCNAVNIKRHILFSFVINEMIGLYLVPTRLRTTNQLSHSAWSESSAACPRPRGGHRKGKKIGAWCIFDAPKARPAEPSPQLVCVFVLKAPKEANGEARRAEPMLLIL